MLSPSLSFAVFSFCTNETHGKDGEVSRLMGSVMGLFSWEDVDGSRVSCGEIACGGGECRWTEAVALLAMQRTHLWVEQSLYPVEPEDHATASRRGTRAAVDYYGRASMLLSGFVACGLGAHFCKPWTIISLAAWHGARYI